MASPLIGFYYFRGKANDDYLVPMMIILWWNLSKDESYLVMKVTIFKEMMKGDVSPVAMFLFCHILYWTLDGGPSICLRGSFLWFYSLFRLGSHFRLSNISSSILEIKKKLGAHCRTGPLQTDLPAPTGLKIIMSRICFIRCPVSELHNVIFVTRIKIWVQNFTPKTRKSRLFVFTTKHVNPLLFGLTAEVSGVKLSQLNGFLNKDLHSVKNAYVSPKKFTPDLQIFYTFPVFGLNVCSCWG